MAQPFDLERLEVAGEPVALLEGVRRLPNTAADYALAANGTLAYVPGGEQPTSAGDALVWVDESGRTVGRAIDEKLVFPFDPRLRNVPERALGDVPVSRVFDQGPLFEERYACTPAGTFEVTLTALEDGWSRRYTLARRA